MKDKVEKMSTYIQLLNIVPDITIGLAYYYKGPGDISHFTYLASEVKDKIKYFSEKPGKGD